MLIKLNSAGEMFKLHLFTDKGKNSSHYKLSKLAARMNKALNVQEVYVQNHNLPQGQYFSYPSRGSFAANIVGSGSRTHDGRIEDLKPPTMGCAIP